MRPYFRNDRQRPSTFMKTSRAQLDRLLDLDPTNPAMYITSRLKTGAADDYASSSLACRHLGGDNPCMLAPLLTDSFARCAVPSAHYELSVMAGLRPGHPRLACEAQFQTWMPAQGHDEPNGKASPDCFLVGPGEAVASQ